MRWFPQCRKHCNSIRAPPVYRDSKRTGKVLQGLPGFGKHHPGILSRKESPPAFPPDQIGLRHQRHRAGMVLQIRRRSLQIRIQFISFIGVEAKWPIFKKSVDVRLDRRKRQSSGADGVVQQPRGVGVSDTSRNRNPGTVPDQPTAFIQNAQRCHAQHTVGGIHCIQHAWQASVGKPFISDKEECGVIKTLQRG